MTTGGARGAARPLLGNVVYVAMIERSFFRMGQRSERPGTLALLLHGCWMQQVVLVTE